MADLRLYEENEQEFISGGVPLLGATSCTTEEVLNDKYLLELEVPTEEGGQQTKLTEGKVIKADGQLFRIYKTFSDLDYTQVKARHIFYDLLRNLIEDARPKDMNANNALNWILDKTQYEHPFTAVSDVEKIATRYFIRKNPVEAIMGDGGIIETWGGEIERDNFKIKLYRNRGKDKGAAIQYRNNLMGLEVETNTDGLATRIMPIGTDGLLLPEKYVDSPDINKYAQPYIKVLETGIGPREEQLDDQGNVETPAITEEEAFALMREVAEEQFSFNHVDTPEVNIKANIILLENTEEYKDLKNLVKVELGDTVSCTNNPIGVEFKAKVIRVKKDILTGRNIEVELGNAKRGLSDTVQDIIEKVEDEIAGQKSDLEEAVKNATDKITGALGGHVLKRKGELLIMDTEDPKTATEVWRWNLAGLGYSKTGVDGPYELAMTMDGEIVADFITTGKLNASLVKLGILESQLNPEKMWINMENGHFHLGGITYNEEGLKIVMNDGRSLEDTVQEGVDEGLANAPIYTWIKYATDKYGTDMGDNPEGATHIGRAFNQTTETPSIYPSDYEWLPIQGESGKDGKDGKDAALAVLTKASETVQTEHDGTGGDFTDVESEVEIYVGGVKDTENWTITGTRLGGGTGTRTGNKYSVETMTEDKMAYTFSATKEGYDKLEAVYTVTKAKKGKPGPRGPEGVEGPPGPTGEPTYTWIKYADDKQGNGMSDYPDDKKFMGIATNQTTKTESTDPEKYEWSKIAGEPGVEGPPGPEGEPTYTWIRYADDKEGNGISSDPEGKRFIGMAHNKKQETPIEDPTLYTWSPLYDNVEVGGRNLLQGTADDEWELFGSSTILESTEGPITKQIYAESTTSSNYFGVQQSDEYKALKLTEGQQYTLSFKARGTVDNFDQIFIMNDTTLAQRLPSIEKAHDAINYQQYAVTFTANDLVSKDDLSYVAIGAYPERIGDWFRIEQVKLEEGNVATDWTESPEDFDKKINQKTDQTDFSELQGTVSEIDKELEDKVSSSIFGDLKREHEKRQDEIAASAAAAETALGDISSRTTDIETWLGKSKSVVNFIDTTITESEEGILIANGNTGVLISDEKLSFLENGTEVAHITNQRLYINHGVFVKSLKVGHHQIDSLEDEEITTIKFMK